MEGYSTLAASNSPRRGYCAFTGLKTPLKRSDGIFRHFDKSDGKVTEGLREHHIQHEPRLFR